MAHIHSVFDSNEHFKIDPLTRAITNSLSKKIVVMQFDHNSERFTFEIPEVDGHNMANCDRVEIHYINMDAVDKTLKSTGVYEVKDIQTSTEDKTKAVFSWLLSRNCTKYSGTLNFLIHFACTVDGVEEYAWNTAIFQSITIGNGMNNGEEVIEPYADVLAQWKADLFGVGDTQEQRLLNVSAEQQAAITARGEAVLATIPGEYEALSALADENHRNKAGAIIVNEKGKSIVVNDASDYPIQNLKVFGKSTQDGTPTPDAPVDIVSVKNPVVIAYGKNLINADNFLDEMFTKVENGYKFTRTADRTSSAICPVNLPAGQYVFSWGISELQGVSCRLYIGHLDGSVETIGMGIEKNNSVVLNANIGIKDLRFSFYSTVEIGSYVVFSYIQLETGNESNEYEPYIETQTVETSHTLPGIPVSSGGNYTDENGQQWICDEVDLARGVYMQRCNKYVVTGGEVVLQSSDRWQKDGMFSFYVRDLIPYGVDSADKINFCLSTHGKPNLWEWGHLDAFNNVGVRKNIIHMSFDSALVGITDNDTDEAKVEKIKVYLAEQYAQGNPVTIQYVLATPIETPLSDAEINAFKALHSNKTVTTVLNDSGAFMEVEYIADTKTYIDNKISELMEGSE